MKIDTGNPKQMLSHVLLQDTNLCKKVAKEYKGAKPVEVVATVFMNGVEVSAESFEDTLKELFSQVDTHYKNTYADMEKAVQKRAKQMVKDRLRGLTDQMYDLENGIEEFLDVQYGRD